MHYSPYCYCHTISISQYYLLLHCHSKSSTMASQDTCPIKCALQNPAEISSLVPIWYFLWSQVETLWTHSLLLLLLFFGNQKQIFPGKNLKATFSEPRGNVLFTQSKPSWLLNRECSENQKQINKLCGYYSLGYIDITCKYYIF